MDSYSKDKINIRPILEKLVIDDIMTLDEKFQNESLRPILKMQHDLIVLMINEFIKMKKNAFYNLSIERRPDYIKDNLLGDRMVIHELRGIVIGLFTLEETDYYLKNKSTINKRIQSLLFQRISSFV